MVEFVMSKFIKEKIKILNLKVRSRNNGKDRRMLFM